MLVEDDNSNVTILTGSNVGTLGVGWDGDGSTIEEEIGSCDTIPPISDDVYQWWRETELDDLLNDFN